MTSIFSIEPVNSNMLSNVITPLVSSYDPPITEVIFKFSKLMILSTIVKFLYGILVGLLTVNVYVTSDVLLPLSFTVLAFFSIVTEGDFSKSTLTSFEGTFTCPASAGSPDTYGLVVLSYRYALSVTESRVVDISLKLYLNVTFISFDPTKFSIIGSIIKLLFIPIIPVSDVTSIIFKFPKLNTLSTTVTEVGILVGLLTVNV